MCPDGRRPRCGGALEPPPRRGRRGRAARLRRHDRAATALGRAGRVAPPPASRPSAAPPVTRRAGAHWRALAKAGGSNAGRIVNTTSGTGLFGNVGQSAYGAAKAAIANLTIVSALEMSRYD